MGPPGMRQGRRTAGRIGRLRTQEKLQGSRRAQPAPNASIFPFDVAGSLYCRSSRSRIIPAAAVVGPRARRVMSVREPPVVPGPCCAGARSCSVQSDVQRCFPARASRAVDLCASARSTVRRHQRRRASSRRGRVSRPQPPNAGVLRRSPKRNGRRRQDSPGTPKASGGIFDHPLPTPASGDYRPVGHPPSRRVWRMGPTHVQLATHWRHVALPRFAAPSLMQKLGREPRARHHFLVLRQG